MLQFIEVFHEGYMLHIVLIRAIQATGLMDSVALHLADSNRADSSPAFWLIAMFGLWLATKYMLDARTEERRGPVAIGTSAKDEMRWGRAA